MFLLTCIKHSFLFFYNFFCFFLQSPSGIIQSTRRERMSVVYVQNVVINSVAALRIFFPAYLLWNLNYTKSNKKIISCIDPKKKNTHYIKSYNFILRIFLFWNCCMAVSLSILQAKKHRCKFGFRCRCGAMTRQFLKK